MKKMTSLVTAVSVGLVSLAASAAKVEVVKVHSDSMGKDVPMSVILPDAYGKDRGRRFPVVYALHGAGGSHENYALPFMGVRGCADKYGIIVACPDGGKTSWWLDSPVDPKMKYETHVVKEVVPYVDAHYRTQADRRHRAIMGGSMGGHGACFLGIRHKDLFGAVGNIFGGVDLRPFPDQWDIKLRLGTIAEHPEYWKEYSVVSQVENLKNGELAFISVLGTSDFFLQVNRDLHEIMIKRGIEHDYVEVRAENTQMSSHGGPFHPRGAAVVMRFFDNFFTTGRGRLM